MKRIFHSILCAAVCVGVVVSCSDNDSFTTSPSALLTFSADTLRLDTVISGSLSATRHIVVRNRGSKGVRIASVGIVGNGASQYQVVADGIAVSPYAPAAAFPIEVRSHDSISAYVRLLPSKASDPRPRPVSASLVFTLQSGQAQAVALDGWAQDVVELMDSVVASDTTLSPSAGPFHIARGLTVAAGATLTLLPGVELLFAPGAGLRVEGTLLARGSLEAPVVFRGDRLDYMFPLQPYDRIPGQWGGVTFASTSYGNALDFCNIHSGSYGLRCDSSDISVEKLRLENSVVHNMKGDCLTLVASRVFVGNCQLTNALGNCVTLRGGDAQFVHCTIGNFYPFEGNRGRALYLYNSLNGRRLPLVRALFENSIVSGWSDDELYAVFLDDNSTAHDYLFRSCLLTTPEPTSADDLARFPSCVFENTADTLWGSRNFRKFDYDTLVFDFRLDSLSRARSSADAAISRQYYPLDRRGIARPAAPSAGCYQYESE